MNNETEITILVTYEKGQFYEINQDTGETKKVTPFEARFPVLNPNGYGHKIFTTEAEFQLR